MKVKMLLLGMCMSLVAMYVEAKDTMYVSRQLLGDDIKKVILGNYSNIEITQGDSNCILYYTKRKQNTIPEICKVEGSKLTLYEHSVGTVKLVLRSDIELLELGQGARAMVTGDFSFTEKKSKISMSEFAKLMFANELKTDIMSFDLKSFATIHANSVYMDSLILKLADFSTTIIDGGYIRGVINTGNVGADVRIDIKTERQSISAVSDVESIVDATNALTDKIRQRAIDKKTKGYWETEFTFGWAAQDWSARSFIQGNVLQNYTLSYGTAYILELKARYVFPEKLFSLDFGIGYESDVLMFADNIYYDGGFGGSGDMIINYPNTSDGLYEVSTKMVARYVTMPIMFNMKLKSLFMGVGVIPGLNYNNSHTGIKETITTQASNGYYETEGHSSYAYSNPFKLDFRAVLGFESFHVFFQTGLLPALDKEMLSAYKIGMMISL
jgi:hypothetical protein